MGGIPNRYYQMAIKYTKRPPYIPNGYRIFKPFPFQGPPNFIQIGTFDLKIYHLATLAVDILGVDTLRGGQFGRRKKSRGQFLTSPLAPRVKFVP
jgi:hypothetical protein